MRLEGSEATEEGSWAINQSSCIRSGWLEMADPWSEELPCSVDRWGHELVFPLGLEGVRRSLVECALRAELDRLERLRMLRQHRRAQKVKRRTAHRIQWWRRQIRKIHPQVMLHIRRHIKMFRPGIERVVYTCHGERMDYWCCLYAHCINTELLRWERPCFVLD